MKKKATRILSGIALTFLLLLPGWSVAQTDSSFNTGVDLVSRYVWRGMNLGGSSPSIQPTIEYSVCNFTLGTWGAFSLNDGFSIQETDLYLSYTYKEMLSFTLTDYFLSNDTIANNNYFEFNEDKTGHLLEASVSFDGTEKIPFTLLAAINFWGADALRYNGKKQYSTYIELGFNGKCKEMDYNIFMGFTPTNPDKEKEEEGYYGTGAGVINMGITVSREIKITDTFNLPVNTSFIINPQTENVFLVFGISL